MLKIWGRNNSINVQKVMWTVAELDLPHQRIDAGGAFGLLDTPTYGAKNPNRLVPVVEDGDLVLWESNAIVRYLAAKHGAGRLWPEDPGQRALSDRWMDWTFTTIMPDLGVVFWGLIRTPSEKRSMAAIEASSEKLAQIFGRLDAHLARHHLRCRRPTDNRRYPPDRRRLLSLPRLADPSASSAPSGGLVLPPDETAALSRQRHDPADLRAELRHPAIEVHWA